MSMLFGGDRDFLFEDDNGVSYYLEDGHLMRDDGYSMDAVQPGGSYYDPLHRCLHTANKETVDES